MSRQSTYSEDIAGEIVERISHGETLRAICRDEGMPAWTTIYKWLAANDSFRERIARARELGFDAIAQEALSIADTPQEGVEVSEVTDVDGTRVTEKRCDMLGHRKLQVETRLKLLAKWDPKRYGDKLELSGDKDRPLVVEQVTFGK